MKQFLKRFSLNWPVLLGGLVGTAVLLFTVQLTLAQDDEEPDAPTIPTQECQECHLDVASHWEDSAHAHAFDDEVFQAQWLALGEPGECLACHTTNFQPATGEYDQEGVSCESCHGETTEEHPRQRYPSWPIRNIAAPATPPPWASGTKLATRRKILAVWIATTPQPAAAV